MKEKKLLALLMSLVLLLGALTVPALAADEETASLEATEAPAGNASDNASADTSAEDAQAALQAQYAQIEAQLDAASKKYDGSAVVATVNGREITWKLCYYLIASMTSQFINYTMAIPDFTTDVGDGTTLQEAMHDALEARMKYYTVPLTEAEERGLAETVNAEVETQWQSVVEQYGSVDALMEAIESAYLDEATYRTLLSSNAAFNAIMENSYGLNGEKLSDEDVLAWANDNNYLRCKHILFLTQNDDGTDKTDEEKAEIRKEAEATLKELRALESDREALLARFDELMADADDPGMTTFPDGYTFTSSQMVQEFEDGTRALEDYAISDIVESSYGYHIILRLPLDPEGKTLSQDSSTGEYMTLRADAANELFNTTLLDWIDTAEVEWQGDFGTMDYNELFTVTEGETTPENGGVNENVQKDANFYRTLGKILPYLLIAVVIAILVTVLTRKKDGKNPETPTETSAEEPDTEPEKAGEPETEEAPTETETPVDTEKTETAPEESPAEAEPETKKEEDE